MGFKKIDYLYYFLIFLISIITVFDLFINVGRSANMDGFTHTTTIGLFYNAMRSGEFPVTWVDGFANYGYPLGIITHQIPNYLGGIITFLTRNPVVSFNLVCLIGILTSNYFYFFFLRLYMPSLYAFVGTMLFNFAPYRIINLYIRGAIPEAFSNLFLPLILLSLYFFIREKKITGLLIFCLSITGLVLTHPMTLIIYAFIFIPYVFFLLISDSQGKLKISSICNFQNLKILTGVFFAGIIGLGIASYYIIPLNIEIKYFYYGLEKNHLTLGQYLNIGNYFNPNWYFFTHNDIFPRGHVIQSGLFETIGLLVGIIFLFFIFWKRQYNKTYEILLFSVLTSILIIFFTTKFSNVFYAHINMLSNIQFPWRMMSAFIFLPPVIIAFILKKINSILLVLFLVGMVCILRFPQLYGKNYTLYPQSSYYFTPLNLHSTVMNTIWSGRSEDYPLKKAKGEIIAGNGSILRSEGNNKKRDYVIDAKTGVRMVDYTFYFPGWNVYVDNVKTKIEFQDENYRGVITYNVPPGQHRVSLKFEDTNVRKVSKVFSLFFLGIFICSFIFRQKVANLVYGIKRVVQKIS